MNKYESVVIMKPNMNKEETSNVISNVKNKISEYANITKEVDMGIKNLAYEIKKNQEAIQEIEQFYKITDEIIKFITVKL